MKAAVVPAVSNSWQVKDVAQPEPGANQVLVKMRASGICYTDVHETLGHIPGSFPRILGHEPVGEIVAVAPDVTVRKVGDRVGTARIQSTCGRCEWCRWERKMFCPFLKGTGIDAQGGHAEYMLMMPMRRISFPTRFRSSRPRRSSARVIRCTAGCAGPVPSRTSEWPCSVSAGWGIWRFNTRKRRASRRSPFPVAAGRSARRDGR
jgi:D-arabinose 1-dehydrogenase-like Zn-dependent alcohol dehydrogenase